MPVAISTSMIGNAGSVSSVLSDALGTLTSSEAVHAVAFNPFEWAASLVAFGGKKSIVGKKPVSVLCLLMSFKQYLLNNLARDVRNWPTA